MNEDPLGFVETPPALADWLASEVLLTQPSAGDRILYPGAGRGNIAAAVHRRCSVRGHTCPDAVAVERNPEHRDVLQDRFVGSDASENHGVPTLPEASANRHESIRGTVARDPVKVDFEIQTADFLTDPPAGPFEYIVANPPYTAYPNIDQDDREQYADQYETAAGRYPLYAPFVEQMLDLLAPNGVLVFLAPVKWLSIGATEPLRTHLRHVNPATPELVPECAFPDHEVITTINVIGHRDADWTGTQNVPSQTRLGLTHAYGRFLDQILRGFGVSEDELGTATSAYRERFESHRTQINRIDTEEREALDPAPDVAGESTQKPLQWWT